MLSILINEWMIMFEMFVIKLENFIGIAGFAFGSPVGQH